MKVEFVNHIIKQRVFQKSKRVGINQKIKTMEKLKYLLFVAVVCLVSKTAIAQNAKTAASNHVFKMCDGYGSPITSSGQSFFLTFYTNGKAIMMCGSDLSKAIRNMKNDPSTSKSGTWQSSENRLWYTLSDGKKSDGWTLDPSTGNFKKNDLLLEDLGAF
jgi:hypothetical protein